MTGRTEHVLEMAREIVRPAPGDSAEDASRHDPEDESLQGRDHDSWGDTEDDSGQADPRQRRGGTASPLQSIAVASLPSSTYSRNELLTPGRIRGQIQP